MFWKEHWWLKEKDPELSMKKNTIENLDSNICMEMQKI